MKEQILFSASVTVMSMSISEILILDPKKKKGNIDSNIFEPTCFKYRQIEVNTTTSWGRTEQRTGSSKAFTVKYKGNKHLLGQTKKEVDVIKVET